jgi:DNA-binding FrmR family transcriptional regulator
MGVKVDSNVKKRAANALKRIEGQVRGVSKMVEEDRYCIDVVTQIEAVRAALARVESDLLRQHLHHCVHEAIASKDQAARERVIEELVGVFKR